MGSSELAIFSGDFVALSVWSNYDPKMAPTVSLLVDTGAISANEQEVTSSSFQYTRPKLAHIFKATEI